MSRSFMSGIRRFSEETLIRCRDNPCRKYGFLKHVSFILLLVFGLAIFMTVSLKDFAYDDAYIHMRIARNFAETGFPYFNVGERVMATSSFVWTCLLAALYRLGVNPFNVLLVLNPLFLIAGLLVWTKMAFKSLNIRGWLLWLFGILYVSWMLPSVVGLMETPLALFLIGSALYLIENGNVLGWSLIPIAVCTRLELIVFIPLLVGHKWMKGGVGWREMLFLCIPFLFLFSAIWHYFGSFFPNTVGAKSLVYPIPMSDVWKGIFKSILPRYKFVFVIALALGVLLAARWRQLWSRRIGLVIFFAGGGIATAYILKHVFLFPWYYPLFGIPVSLGVLWIAHESRRVWVRIALAVLIGVHPMSVFSKYVLAAGGKTDVLPGADAGARVQRYLEVGECLSELFPDASLLTSEIGGLGYGFRGKIIDGVGLVSPDSLRFHPMRVPEQRSSVYYGAIPSALIDEKSPELIVSYPLFLEEFLRTDWQRKYIRIKMPAFSEKTRLQIAKDDIWGCDELFVFIRRDLASNSKTESFKNLIR